jgi:hypothetical protein
MFLTQKGNNMTITEKLRLEVYIREQHQKHGDDFYVELAKVLEKIQNEQKIDNDPRGKPTFGVRWN